MYVSRQYVAPPGQPRGRAEEGIQEGEGGRPTSPRAPHAPPPQTLDADDARRKREDAALAIRKEKKEENLQKKRREVLPNVAHDMLKFGADARLPPMRVRRAAAPPLSRAGRPPAGTRGRTFHHTRPAAATLGSDATRGPQLESLPAMVQGVASDDPAQQLEATQQFRKLLSIGARAA